MYWGVVKKGEIRKPRQQKRKRLIDDCKSPEKNVEYSRLSYDVAFIKKGKT